MQASPSQVEITYSEGVEPKFSTIEVLDAAGKRVDKQDPHIDGSDTVLAVGVPTLPPGTYKVIWHATAVDTHKTEGTAASLAGSELFIDPNGWMRSDQPGNATTTVLAALVRDITAHPLASVSPGHHHEH